MKTTEEKIKVMQAYQEGKPIIGKSEDGRKWIFTKRCPPTWDWSTIDYSVETEDAESKLVPYGLEDEEELKCKTLKGVESGYLYTVVDCGTATIIVKSEDGILGRISYKLALQAFYEVLKTGEEIPFGKMVIE